MKKEELGSWGEQQALNFLIRKGYQLLDKNVRFKRFEIDLLMLDENELVIVEVKTRSTNQLGEPWRSVTKLKQKQIITVADWYIQKNQIDRNTRFDIVSLIHVQDQTRIDHIQDAFSATF